LIIGRSLLATAEGGINLVCDCPFHLVETESTQVRDLEFLRDRAALLMPFEGGGDQPKVFVKRVRYRFQSRFLQILGADASFQRKKRLSIRVLSSEMRVIQWEHQRINIRHPAKTRRLNAGAHVNAIGKHDVDAR